jgi:hypothetical protein
MSKFSKILMGIWGVLAILSFVSAFFAPIYFMIVGLVFGGLNMLVILSVVIAYFQMLYYQNKLNKQIEEYGQMQLQESEETTQEKA